MIWYTYRLESLFTCLIDRDIAAFKVLVALETDLANQKGYVSYYFMDGNPEWLIQLEKYRQSFEEHLNKARKYIFTESDVEIINQIELEYKRYIKVKDQVIVLYRAGEKEAGAEIHMEGRALFFKILELCENYKNIHFEKIYLSQKLSRTQAERVRIIAGATMSGAIFLSVILAVILMTQVLDPVRKLALEIDRSNDCKQPRDEVVSLRHQVHDLIKDMEKFAIVGKFAAGVAHSIRNPLASVKMRLFSIERGLELSPIQRRDFEVITEEIRHINNIIQNFLEFSRPPERKIQKGSPSDIVDNSLRLLRHRLESYNVEIRLRREKRLPEVLADPEQLKDVLVNLIVNACEAMVNGGVIVIDEEEDVQKGVVKRVMISVRDEGPGIPDSIREKIFQPFFTCKEDGTGLGLTIAARIISEHGGWIDLKSRQEEGAVFIVILPVEEEKDEQDSNSR